MRSALEEICNLALRIAAKGEPMNVEDGNAIAELAVAYNALPKPVEPAPLPVARVVRDG